MYKLRGLASWRLELVAECIRGSHYSVTGLAPSFIEGGFHDVFLFGVISITINVDAVEWALRVRGGESGIRRLPVNVCALRLR